MEYWNVDNFDFKKTKLSLSTNVQYYIEEFEPFFDKIIYNDSVEDYIKTEQKHTNFDLSKKFNTDESMTNIKFKDNITSKDFEVICQLQLIIPQYDSGIYEVGNLIIEI